MTSRKKILEMMDFNIQESNAIYKSFLEDRIPWKPEFVAWLKSCEVVIESAFGSNSHALNSFKSIYFVPPPNVDFKVPENSTAEIFWFESGLRYAQFTLVAYRYSYERLTPEESRRPNPYVFVSHGGPSRFHVDATRDLLAAVGLSPIIVADLPNLGMSVNDKVRSYMSICGSAVVLATEEDELTSGERRARPNVENEIGLLQNSANIGNRIVYMKEPDVKFASNYSEKVWIEFKKEEIATSFVSLLKELKAFGLLGWISAG